MKTQFKQNERERYYKTGRKSLTEPQVKKLLSVITDLKHLALFQVAISTGIRRSDIVSLKTGDFEQKTRKLSFYEQKKRRNRTVYLSDEVSTTLQMVINSEPKQDHFFPGSSNGHMSSKTAYNILQKYLKKAELEQRPFHSLRATCIKLCQKRGWKPEETAELVGDSLKVIQEHYSIPSSDEMSEVTKEKSIL